MRKTMFNNNEFIDLAIDNSICPYLISIARYENGEDINLSAKSSTLLFVLTGIVLIYYNHKPEVALKSGQMLLIPVNSDIRVVAESFSELATCVFCDLSQFNPIISFDKISLQIENKTTVLPITDHLIHFFEFIKSLQQAEKDCPELNQLLVEELFILLRINYTQEDLISLFSFFICKSIDFKNVIHVNYKYLSIKELANCCNMSLPTFNRHFRENFGQSALQWINKKKAEAIWCDLKQNKKTFTEIADENNFSSTSYLTTFCKKYFNNTPEQIRFLQV